MKPFFLPQLDELQALRKKPVILYHAPIENDTVPVLYECLRQIGPTQQLDLVLSTSGGIITVARRLALLLREFTHSLTILVPYQAWSAGTLLCLSANELVLGPLAELGPIDAQMSSVGSPPPGTSGVVAAEDIRMFRQMAEDWFGVIREKDRLQVLALVAQQVFPPSLSSFYRADKLMRQAAYELLSFQLPTIDENERQKIADHFINGYYAHTHRITRLEARQLGLQVSFPSSQEEEALWTLSKRIRKQASPQDGMDLEETGVFGFIASRDFSARRIQRWRDYPGAGHRDVKQEKEIEPYPRQMPQFFWEIEGE